MSSHEVSTERKFEVAGSTAPKKIAKIQFGTLPTDEIQRCAELQGKLWMMIMMIICLLILTLDFARHSILKKIMV